MVAIPPSLPNLPNLCFGPFELNPASGELRKSGILIKLQPQPFRLLLLLAERSGTVVAREEIQRCLWTESTFVDFEHGINFSVNQIRTALADDAEKPRFIETLPRRGYRFIATVQVSSNGHNAGPRVQDRWTIRSAIAVVVTLVALVGGGQYWRAAKKAKISTGVGTVALSNFVNSPRQPA